MNIKEIRSTMKRIRSGEVFRAGFKAISYYNETKDTFMVDNLYNGQSIRGEFSAYQVRNILREIQ